MRVAIGCDHAGVEYKPYIVEHLKSRGEDVIDFGTDSTESVDYPDYAEKVGLAVINNEADLGILICGTGLGMAIAANKINGIRAVTVSEPLSAMMARAHNNANILTFGSRVTGRELAVMLVDAFLDTPFEGGRHNRRVAKIRLLQDSSVRGQNEA